MVDRPEAPRLEEALARLADQAKTDTAAKAETAALLELATTDDTVPPLHLRAPTTDRSSSTRVGSRFVAVAAGLVIAALAALAFIDDRSSQRYSTEPAGQAGDGGDPQPVETDRPLPPRLTRDDLCRSTGTDAEVTRLLDTASGTIEVGVRADPGTAIDTKTVLVVGPGSDWRSVAEQATLHDDLRATAIVYAATTGVDPAAIGPMTDHVAENLCEQGPLYLFSIDDAMGSDVACFTADTTSFSGFVFAGHDIPPTSCTVRRPTLVLGDDNSTGRRDRWATHMGCGNPTTRLDDSSTAITTWASCRNTLVHVATGANPWPETIDGEPAIDFLYSAISVAN